MKKIPVSVVKTDFYNFKTLNGSLAVGCEYCVRGEKLVLFVTGVCGNNCFYCPVSDAKNDHDVVFANEKRVFSDDDLLEEAFLMRANGAGITGGDPLAVIDRTCHYIRLLKEAFGREFHIHLYTPLLRVNKMVLKRLFDAGLDEIRFHPKLDDDSLWDRLLLARDFPWSVGVEIPVIPGFEDGIKKLVDFVIDNKAVDFLNLNEFEFADNKVFEKSKRLGFSFEPKNKLSYAVKGSLELGVKILDYASKKGLAAHFCTAKSKDAIQLAKRIKRRSERAAAVFDIVDDEGLLLRGAVYDPVISIKDAGFSRRVSEMSVDEKKMIVERLSSLRRSIINDFSLSEDFVVIDEPRLRLLTSASLARVLAKSLNNPVFIVKEYPTDDCFIVEADPLN